ncbi:hypothetical protein M5689_000045 [Euphorbia peplus]|nr:hypothetical protein M5689_000045 [Euphorbia peplus]
MDSQRKFFVCSITILLSLFIQSPCEAVRATSPSPSPAPSPHSPSIPPLVKKLCAKTAGSEAFCIKTLISEKKSWQAKNFVELTKIFVSMGQKHATHTQKYIIGLAKKKGETPESKKALDACADDYSRIYSSFGAALLSIKDGEYDEADYDIKVCFDQINMCKTVLSNAKINPKGISEAIDVTTHFINIGSTFTNSLPGH